MDRPDAVGHIRRRRGVSSAAQGGHAGAAGCGAPGPGARGSTGRSIRGYRAGHSARGASEAAYLGRGRAVRAVAVCDRAQQADRCAAPARKARVRQHRRFLRDAGGSAGRGEGLAKRGGRATEYAAGAPARRAAVDRSRQRLDQGYREKVRDERGCGARGAASGARKPHRESEGTVRMETDQLIKTLAADNPHRARPVSHVLAMALLAAAPVSILMFVAELGVRSDVRTAMHNPFFDLKFAVTLALAAAAITISLHLSRPEASLRGFVWLLAIPP